MKMTRPQQVLVGGRKFKRITTAYSWRSAQSMAKMERKRMSAVVVIRKDPNGSTYGVFSRPQLTAKGKPKRPYKRFSGVEMYFDKAFTRRAKADKYAQMKRNKGYYARVAKMRSLENNNKWEHCVYTLKRGRFKAFYNK